VHVQGINELREWQGRIKFNPESTMLTYIQISSSKYKKLH